MKNIITFTCCFGIFKQEDSEEGQKLINTSSFQKQEEYHCSLFDEIPKISLESTKGERDISEFSGNSCIVGAAWGMQSNQFSGISPKEFYLIDEMKSETEIPDMVCDISSKDKFNFLDKKFNFIFFEHFPFSLLRGKFEIEQTFKNIDHMLKENGIILITGGGYPGEVYKGKISLFKKT